MVGVKYTWLDYLKLPFRKRWGMAMWWEGPITDLLPDAAEPKLTSHQYLLRSKAQRTADLFNYQQPKHNPTRLKFGVIKLSEWDEARN